MAFPTADDIAGSLLQAAEARATHLGLHFQIEVHAGMKDMAWHGAERILSFPKKPESAERFVRAATRVGSETMVVFVDEMAVQRLIIPNYVKEFGSELRINLWSQVRDILCPIWPIC